jgi:YHS domain-containing protein
MINPSRRLILAIIGFGMLAQGIGTATADKPAVSSRVALKGYDPVSYFKEGQPQKGSVEFSASFEDAIYWFKNAEHHALFLADPAQYAPQFGGWCTMSLSRGEIVEANPEAWVIDDGKLYVFTKKVNPALFEEQRANNFEIVTRNWRELRKNP